MFNCGFIQKTRLLIKSHEFHIAIVTLVIIDCLCIAGELLISELAKHILDEQEHDCVAKENSIRNKTNFSTNSSHNTTEIDEIHKNDYHVLFNVIESILSHFSTLILGIFTVEVFVKLVLVPDIFIKSKWEILDAVIVIISFSINITLIVMEDSFEGITGLFVLLRLWRIGEIVNGAIVTLESRHKEEVERLKNRIKILEEELKRLKFLKPKILK